MAVINAAVVGAGFIGPVHVEALQRLGINVTGILGISREESESAARNLNLPKAYDSYDQIIHDDSIHSVHITTPNRLHYDMAREALQAGKHVMCEKPLAMNARESAELVNISTQSKCVAGVNYNIRYYPLCLDASAKVKQGHVGDIFSVCGSYVQDWLLYPTDYNWRVLADEGGALRAIADIGTHWLDLIYHITGLEVEAVCADLQTIHPVRQRPIGEVQTFKSKEDQTPTKTESIDITTEDYGCVMIRFQSNARGCLWVSQATAGRKNCLRYEIAGSQSALSWCSEQPNELWIGYREKPNESLLRDPSLVSDAASRYINYPGGHNEGFPDTFKQCFRSFYEYVEAGNYAAPPTFPTFADGHREIILCEAIMQSHRENRWVTI